MGILDGQIDVLADSVISQYNVRSGTPFHEHVTTQFDSALRLAEGVTTTLLGNGTYLMANDVTTDGQTSIVLDDGRLELNGTLVAGGAESHLRVTGNGNTILNSSVRVSTDRSFLLTDGDTAPTIELRQQRFVTGGGILKNALRVGDGGLIRPGDGAGRLTIDGNVELASAGVYEWELKSLDPMETGSWDSLLTTGNIAFTSTVESPFTFMLLGADAAEFDPRQEYRWNIASANQITGFDLEHLVVNTVGFTEHHTIPPGAKFLLELTGSNLDILYRLLPQLGDFNEDGQLDSFDIDQLSEAIIRGANESAFDLNEDSIVNGQDRRIWVEDLKETYFGDANLDGVFSTRDLIAVFQAGLFEDEVDGNGSWSTGDWDGNGDFDTGDFVIAFQGGGFGVGPRPAHTVPESGSAAILMLCCLLNICRIRKMCHPA